MMIKHKTSMISGRDLALKSKSTQVVLDFEIARSQRVIIAIYQRKYAPGLLQDVVLLATKPHKPPWTLERNFRKDQVILSLILRSTNNCLEGSCNRLTQGQIYLIQ